MQQTALPAWPVARVAKNGRGCTVGNIPRPYSLHKQMRKGRPFPDGSSVRAARRKQSTLSGLHGQGDSADRM